MLTKAKALVAGLSLDCSVDAVSAELLGSCDLNDGLSIGGGGLTLLTSVLLFSMTFTERAASVLSTVALS